MAPHHKRVRPKIGPIDFEAAKKRGGVREPGGERRAEERNGGEGEDGEGVVDQVSPTTSSGSLVALITPTSGLERWTDRAKVKSTASSPQSDTSSRLSEDKRAIELAAPRSARIQRAGIALNEATGQARSTFFVAEPSTSQQSGDVVQEGEENRAVDKFVATLQTLTIRSTRRTEQGVVSIAPTPDSIQASKDIFLAKRRSLIRVSNSYPQSTRTYPQDIQDLMAVGDYHRSVMDSLNDTTSCSEPLSAWEEQAKARTRVILRKNSRQLFHARWALQHIGDVLENIDNGPRG